MAYLITSNGTLLESVLLGTVTSIGPVVAFFGTFAVISVSEICVYVVDSPLKLTLPTPANSLPMVLIVLPTFPTPGTAWTNGARPIDKLYTVPSPRVPAPPNVVP